MNHEKQVIQVALAIISWEGNSLEALKQWPRDIQRDFGMSLLNLQKGERPDLQAVPCSPSGRESLN